MKNKLTEFEKNITITTSLSAEDIFLYEKHFNRKLDGTELKNAAYFRDNGIRLNHNLKNSYSGSILLTKNEVEQLKSFGNDK